MRPERPEDTDMPFGHIPGEPPEDRGCLGRSQDPCIIDMSSGKMKLYSYITSEDELW